MACLPAPSMSRRTPPENCTMGMGTGKAAGGFFGNTKNSTKLFDVAASSPAKRTNFRLPRQWRRQLRRANLQQRPLPVVNDGLNAVIAGPVFSPASVDLVVTDDYYDLYVMEGNGDGTFGAPVALGQTAFIVERVPQFQWHPQSGRQLNVTFNCVRRGNFLRDSPGQPGQRHFYRDECAGASRPVRPPTSTEPTH